MYKRVTNLKELTTFDSIWMETWTEKGFEVDPYSANVIERYLIMDGHAPIGTVEFKKYTPRVGELDQIAPFYAAESIRMSPDTVVEVDKVAIRRDQRGKHIDKMMTALMLFAEQWGCRQYVSLLDPVFYRALRIVFNIRMDVVSNERPYYKGAPVVPAILHVSDVVDNKERYPWLLQTQPSATNLAM
ncbi:hypothetical protein [Cohnella yongneupensis]|uniref:N-acetyltransferase domain-containing protein n=1 Tax=Cohnella yongneupensis TaxID=425006 RepID=A0ABW0R3T1_9BACL